MPYRAGSFRSSTGDFPEARVSRGCLDIGIRAAQDARADGPVLDIALGNRCDEGVWVDLSALEISAQLADGRTLQVGLYDPRQELHAAVLGGREFAQERIEIEAPITTVLLCAQLDRFSAARAGGPPQILCAEVQGT